MDSRMFLHSEQDQERHHQTEKTHGFRQGESQDGIREQLLLQGWVPTKTGTNAALKHKTNPDRKSVV